MGWGPTARKSFSADLLFSAMVIFDIIALLGCLVWCDRNKIEGWSEDNSFFQETRDY